MRTTIIAQIGVAHGKLGPAITFQLGEHVQTLRPAEIIETVTGLQIFHLCFEDEVERAAQQTAKGHFLFGEAANPEFDSVEAAGFCIPDASTGQECNTVSRGTRSAKDQSKGSIALFFNSGRRQDRFMLSIGRDEVDHRSGVLDRKREIEPVVIGLQLRVASLRIEIGANLVQRSCAGFTTAGDVERCKVKRQADKIIAQRIGYEFVDFIANLTGHAAEDGARCFLYRRTGTGKCRRVEEGFD